MYPQRQQANINTELPKSHSGITLICGLSNPIQRILASLHIRTCFCSFRVLSNILVHPKEPVSPDQRKGVVYWIPCADCEMTYVGQTGRILQVHRKKKHLRTLITRPQPWLDMHWPTTMTLHGMKPKLWILTHARTKDVH